MIYTQRSRLTIINKSITTFELAVVVVLGSGERRCGQPLDGSALWSATVATCATGAAAAAICRWDLFDGKISLAIWRWNLTRRGGPNQPAADISRPRYE